MIADRRREELHVRRLLRDLRRSRTQLLSTNMAKLEIHGLLSARLQAATDACSRHGVADSCAVGTLVSVSRSVPSARQIDTVVGNANVD